MMPVLAVITVLLLLTAQPSRARCWRASYSVTKEVLSEARAHKPEGGFRWRTGARCSWTKLATCRWNFSPSSYARCRSVSSSVWAAQTIQVDVRVIAATNQDLWQMVLEKRFRADL